MTTSLTTREHKTTGGATITLTRGACERCGLEIDIIHKSGTRFICCDCRDDIDRERRGWHPENSRD